MGLTFSFVRQRRWWRQTGQCQATRARSNAHQTGDTHSNLFTLPKQSICQLIWYCSLLLVRFDRPSRFIVDWCLASMMMGAAADFLPKITRNLFIHGITIVIAWRLTISRMMSTPPAKSVIIQCCLRFGYFADEVGVYLRLLFGIGVGFFPSGNLHGSDDSIRYQGSFLLFTASNSECSFLLLSGVHYHCHQRIVSD